jgi:hypothetical protein
MDIEGLKAKARTLVQQTQAEAAKPYFQRSIAWLVYLGLLRHNEVKGRRCLVTLAELLRAGAIEPRILEVLPALLIHIPEAVKFRATDVPDDVRTLLTEIKRRKATRPFRGVPAEKYLSWLAAPALELAAKRFYFRTMPRQRRGKVTRLADVISQGRIERAMTQKQLAETHGLSLRVIRDLEQGKVTASFQHVSDVLSAVGRKLIIT